MANYWRGLSAPSQSPQREKAGKAESIDPNKLEAVATSITGKYGQKYPLTVLALRSKAAALRVQQPHARRLSITTARPAAQAGGARKPVLLLDALVESVRVPSVRVPRGLS
jgi:hypothetical protein